MFKSKKIITNLRMDENDYLQVKSMAAETGMSVNEYINYAVEKVSRYRELSPGFPAKTAFAKSDPIWKLGEIGKKIKKRPSEKLSPEDKTIYG